jgi:hypothetical protein
MKEYVHYVSGFFAHSKEANDVLEKLVAQGLPRGRVLLYTELTKAPVHEPTESSNQVLKEILVDGTIGIARLGCQYWRFGGCKYWRRGKCQTFIRVN